MKNNLSDLRNHLFETIERLKANSDPEASDNEKIDIEDAKVIGNLGKILVESAKVEVLFVTKAGGTSSGFIESKKIDDDSLNQTKALT